MARNYGKISLEGGGGGDKQFSLFKESTKLPSSYLVMK